jgi:hypothetical protein
MPLSPFQIAKSSPGINVPPLDAALRNGDQRQITSVQDPHPVGAGKKFLHIAQRGLRAKVAGRNENVSPVRIGNPGNAF